MSLSQAKRDKIIALCKNYLSKDSLSLLQLQILGGNLNHAAPVIPGSSLRLQWCGRAASIAFNKKNYVLSKYDNDQLYWWCAKLADSSCMIHIPKAVLRPVTNIWSRRITFVPFQGVCYPAQRRVRLLRGVTHQQGYLGILCMVPKMGKMLHFLKRIDGVYGGSRYC